MRTSGRRGVSAETDAAAVQLCVPGEVQSTVSGGSAQVTSLQRHLSSRISVSWEDRDRERSFLHLYAYSDRSSRFDDSAPPLRPRLGREDVPLFLVGPRRVAVTVSETVLWSGESQPSAGKKGLRAAHTTRVQSHDLREEVG